MEGRQIVRRSWVLVVALVALLRPDFAAAQTTSHSGTVLAVDKDDGSLLLSEVGPWCGATEISRRTIRVTPSTEVVQATRTPAAGRGGWVGDFIEVRLIARELRTGGEWP